MSILHTLAAAALAEPQGSAYRAALLTRLEEEFHLGARLANTTALEAARARARARAQGGLPAVSRRSRGARLLAEKIDALIGIPVDLLQHQQRYQVPLVVVVVVVVVAVAVAFCRHGRHVAASNFDLRCHMAVSLSSFPPCLLCPPN